MMTFDAHIHIWPPDRQIKLLRWIKKSWPNHPVKDDITVEEIIEDLNNNGIDAFINLVYPLSPEETVSLNFFNVDLSKKYDFIFPFASLHQHNDNKEAIIKEAFYEMGMIGLKFHPFIQKMDIRDPGMDEVWAICENLKKPVFLHTGYEAYYGMEMSPSWIRNILEHHPELYLVLSHLCFPDLKEAFNMARDFPGVYLDLTNVPGSLTYLNVDSEEAIHMTEMLRSGVREFSGRVFFGSDHPVGLGSLAEIYAQLKSLGLSKEDYSMLTMKSPVDFLERFKP